jgi:hypothetical protein
LVPPGRFREKAFPDAFSGRKQISDRAKLLTMKRTQWCLTVTVCLVAGVALGSQSSFKTQDVPPVDEILRRMVERAHTQEAEPPPDAYLCTKQTVTEDMDPDGRITERKVRTSESRSGGRGSIDASKWSNKNGFNLDLELLRRYRFSLIGEEKVNGRTTLVLAFAPKQSTLPTFHLQDRLLNRAKGTVWVDAQEYDLVKANICLGEPVSFGILGAVDEFTFAFERARSDDGNWLTSWTETFVKARKFLKPVQTRRRVDWRDYRRASATG